ncbi:MAG: helix-turn-helix transcriptional regulator [Sedimentisphaeraceae bacterium JB056]
MNDFDVLPDGIIAYANYASFTAGKVIEFDKVQSRMLLWCENGTGQVIANGRKFIFDTDTFLLLPWNHSIAYRPDSKRPFLVAGIHLIPAFKRGNDFQYDVFHAERSDLLQYRLREDVYIDGFEGVYQGSWTEGRRLKNLVSYIVDLFSERPVEELVARQLASVLMSELVDHRKNTGRSFVAMPLSVKLAIDYIKRNDGRRIDISELSRHAGCCRSKLFRLFSEYTGKTPGNYVIDVKMKTACTLLRQSNFTIGRIADKVGVSDRYYFSKLFRKYAGMTPTEYRARNSLVPEMD